jgi:hypothetical protein
MNCWPSCTKTSLVHAAHVIRYDLTPAGRVELKVRCRIVGGYQLQVWLHEEPELLDYAYQLFSAHPILRWDNSPHYSELPGAPHHFHDSEGQVGGSSLTGDPIKDIRLVLSAVEEWLASQ